MSRLKPMRETVRDELEIPLPGPGGAREKVEQDSNTTLKQDRGASYTLRRLKRDRPDLAEAFYDRLDALPDDVMLKASLPDDDEREHGYDDEARA